MKDLILSPSLHNGILGLTSIYLSNLVIFSTTDEFYHFCSIVFGVIITTLSVVNLIWELWEKIAKYLDGKKLK